MIRRLSGDRGDAAIEAVLLAPALLLMVIMAIVAGRFYTAQSAVAEAARSSARAASLATDGADAQARAAAVLSQQNLRCAGLTVTVDTSQFALPPGQTGYVTATVTCDVALSDLATPGLAVPGSRTASATFRSPIDRYGPRP